MRIAPLAALSALTLSCTLAACIGGETGSDSANATALPYAEGSTEALAVLALVNDRDVTQGQLDDDARLDRRAATAIIAHRDGADGQLRTDDDDLFDTLGELDAVKRVGPKAVGRLFDYAVKQGYYDDQLAKKKDVIFSPQSYELSHLARVAELIDSAERSIDIAMYSYSDGGIADALSRAVERGVDVRFIFHSALADKSKSGDALASTKSAGIEKLGINVRYVNKIMHHKFMIVDGPRDDRDSAWEATIATGSGNWSHSAGTRYDENTLVLTAYPELALRMQGEFDLMWSHSRDFVYDAELPFELSTFQFSEESVPDNPGLNVFFTSTNFDIKGETTFTVNGANTVSDELSRAIRSARRSIHIASGHLRSRPVALALMEAMANNPELDVRIVLDDQEYISQWKEDSQKAALDECLAGAGDNASARRGCLDKGYYYSYEVAEAGAGLRYKFYAYRWHYSYAEQMHHKYMIIDDTDLYTGSYNLSDNAEHNTFENMLLLRGPEFSDLVARYQGNFEHLWALNRDNDTLAELQSEVSTANPLPLVFTPMALEWQEVTDLKQLIKDNCPDVNAPEYRTDPKSHQKCYR